MIKPIGSQVELSFTGKLIGVREDPYDDSTHKRLLYKIQISNNNFYIKEEFEVLESCIVRAFMHPDDAIHLGGN